MTNNEQTPGGNTTTAGAVEQLAQRIADETIPEDSDAYDTHEARMADWYVARDAALAAIIETAEANAATITTLREEIEYLKSRLPARIGPQFKGDDNDGR